METGTPLNTWKEALLWGVSRLSLSPSLLLVERQQLAGRVALVERQQLAGRVSLVEKQ